MLFVMSGRGGRRRIGEHISLIFLEVDVANSAQAQRVREGFFI